MSDFIGSFEVDDHKNPKQKRGKGGIIAIGVAVAAALVILVSIIHFVYNLFSYEYQMEKHGGHGFNYMGGYSSTDFTGYHVYDGENLVELDHPADFMIENVQDMPVLDGAEACYPVYTAVAKALYKDIDRIEEEALFGADESDDYNQRDWGYNNGRVVTFTNTLHGYERLVYGEVDLVFAARPSSNIKETAYWYNEQIVSIPIGREAFVFFVEKDNPVDNLTADEVRRIYSGEITNWKEVGGKDQKIIAFQRPEEAGSQVMMEYFMGDVPLMEPDRFSVIDAMDGVIEHVKEYKNKKGAIGYTFQYFLTGLQQEKDVKMLSVDGVYPSVDNIENGTYPVTVSLVVAKLASNEKENVQKVIDFLLSKDGQEIIERTGYGALALDETGKVKSDPIIENELPKRDTYILDNEDRDGRMLVTETILEVENNGVTKKYEYFLGEDGLFAAYDPGLTSEEYPICAFFYRCEDEENTIIITDVQYDTYLIVGPEEWATDKSEKYDFIKVGDRFERQ